MTEEGPPPPKRVCINRDEIAHLSKEELIQRWQQQDEYINSLVSSSASAPGNDQNDDQLRKQQQEAARRENVLVMRLTTKEQEMQDYLSQLEELKRSQNPSTAHLRDILLDPAINLMFQRMKKEMDVCKEKLEQAQNDLAAWKFTPDGQTGKRLMAKCRMLLQENDELGNNISSGRTAKLEGEVALEKKFVEEMKASQAETDEFLAEMDEDVEGLQSTIYLLQQQLKDAKDQVIQLQTENAQLKHMAADMAAERTGGIAAGDGLPMETSYEETANASVEMHQGMHGSSQSVSMASEVPGSGVIAQQQQRQQQHQMDNMATNAQTIVIQPTAGENTALRTSVTGNGIHHNNESNFSAATTRTGTGDLSVERTEQETGLVPKEEPADNSQDKRYNSREGTPTLEEQSKMDTSETFAEKQHSQDNGLPPTEAATNSYSTNCHDSSNVDNSRPDVPQAFKDGADRERPERTATPTMDDSSDQMMVGEERRTLNVGGAKGEGVVVTNDSKELVQNGLIGTQYDSSQDEM